MKFEDQFPDGSLTITFDAKETTWLIDHFYTIINIGEDALHRCGTNYDLSVQVVCELAWCAKLLMKILDSCQASGFMTSADKERFNEIKPVVNLLLMLAERMTKSQDARH